MGLDMSKMKAKWDKFKNGGVSNNSRTWKPEEGEQTIRIVPTQDGDPFRDFYFHYGVGKEPGFLSPKKNFGEADPLDDFVRSLYNEGTDEAKDMARQIRAKQRFFCPVIVRGEEDKGVRIWGFGKTVYETIFSLIMNEDYGDITDVSTGTDLVLKYEKPSGKGSYPVTKLTPKRFPSPLAETPEQVASLLESVPDMDGMFERKTPEQVQTILDQFLLGDGNAEDFSSEVTRGGGDSSDNSVDKAFKDLLG